jgi:hypothetical protein
MGFMTLRMLREDLNFALGEKSQASNEPLDRWINRAYYEIVGRMAGDLTDLHSVEVITTTACDPSYPVPAAVGRRFLSILSIADLTNKRRLLYIAPRNYHLRDQAPCSVPELWTKQGASVLLWPAPRAGISIQVYGVLEPLPLAAEADTTLLPASLDHGILLLATRNAYMAFRMKEDATLAYQAAENYLRSIQSEMQLNEGTPSVGVQIAESYDDLTVMRGDSIGGV